MIAPRRLTFQLTPLLDLLLIVIFAQYMEVRQTTSAAQADLEQRQKQLQTESEQHAARLAQHFEQQRRELEQRVAQQKAELERQRQEYSRRFESILQQHQQAGAALAEAFQLPGRLLEEVLKLRSESGPDGSARLQRAVARLKTELESRHQQLIQFALKYDEMEKHVSIWEVYIQENGQCLFSDGSRAGVVSFESSDEFVSRAFEVSKSFTEPRPLVIILMSYGNTQAVQVRRVTAGLPDLVARLRNDAGGTRWFDFSLMGYHADGPVFTTARPVSLPDQQRDNQ